MVYVVTKTFNTASWIYYGRREEGGRFFPKDFKKIQVPTGISIFPAEQPKYVLLVILDDPRAAPHITYNYRGQLIKNISRN
mgnify:CR=1 FL=1